MVSIKLYRDDARLLQMGFFPFLTRLCYSKVISTKHDSDEQLLAIAIRSVFIIVERKFALKLAGVSNKFKFSFSDHEAVILYRLLMAYPIPMQEVYMNVLRQKVTNMLFEQLGVPSVMS